MLLNNLAVWGARTAEIGKRSTDDYAPSEPLPRILSRQEVYADLRERLAVADSDGTAYILSNAARIGLLPLAHQ